MKLESPVRDDTAGECQPACDVGEGWGQVCEMVPEVEDEGCCVDRPQVCTTGYLDVKGLLLRVGQKCEIKPQESKTYTVARSILKDGGQR